MNKLMGWQPIETAPKDEIRFLAYEAGRWAKYAVCYYDWIANSWYLNTEGATGYECEIDITPTHWMPLPKPPEAE